jgi:hypothetical protein
MADTRKKPRVHVIELTSHGFRYYRGAFKSFGEAPPRYTWIRVDYRVYDNVVYVDMQKSIVENMSLLFP